MYLFILLAGCSSEGSQKQTEMNPQEETPLRGPCNPVEEEHCLLPFPSDYYLEEGRLSFPEGSMPVNVGKMA